jgi:hypothetical protein
LDTSRTFFVPTMLLKHRLVGIHLHERHVLVRARVEDDLRAVHREDALELLLVDDVADDLDQARESRGPRELVVIS